jgi:hypothetical protein
MKRVFVTLFVAGLLALLTVPLYAGGGTEGVVPQVSGSFVDKSYAAATPDSGTCGNNWAVDLFNRQFTVFPQNGDGSWTVEQKFLNGKFISLGNGQSGSASSPGACNSGPDNGNTLKEGRPGTFSGSFTITVEPGFSFVGTGGCGTLADWPVGAGNGTTPGDCTTKGWVETHFPGATYGGTATVTSFNVVYKAKIGGVTKTWTNSSSGNVGDICTTGSC